MTIRLSIAVDAGRFAAEFGGEGEAPFAVPLSPSHLASDLDDLAIMLQATGGAMTTGLRRHLEEHFVRGSAPSGACAFCKLQGRVLAGQGRRRLREEEHRARVIPAQGADGEAATFSVTRLVDGATYAAAVRAERRAAQREAERERRQPRLGLGRRAKGLSGTDLADLF